MAEWTGEIKSVFQDFATGKFNVTLTINEGVPIVNALQNMLHKKLNIKAVQYREKRSLDANAYLWVLCSKLAEVHRTSKEEIYEEMLQKYGVFYQDEDSNYITITVKSNVDMSKISGHWKFYKGNEKFSSYLMIKGTSEYDTREMALFIDAVVLEAKEEGIETMTPDELERMKSAWQKQNQ